MNHIRQPAKYQVTSNKFYFVKFEDERILNRHLTINAQDWYMLDVLYLPAVVCCWVGHTFLNLLYLTFICLTTKGLWWRNASCCCKKPWRKRHKIAPWNKFNWGSFNFISMETSLKLYLALKLWKNSSNYFSISCGKVKMG